MKKVIVSLLMAAACVAAKAQTTNSNTAIEQHVLSFLQTANSNKSVTIAAYPMYAPDIVVNGKKDTFGLGLALLTPANMIPGLDGTFIGNHGFAGLRFDYLAHEAFASTIGVGLKGTMQIKGHDFMGFVHGGANIPFSGFGQNNINIGGMAGGGGYTDIHRFSSNAVLGVQASVEKWTQFPGEVFLGGPVFNWNF